MESFEENLNSKVTELLGNFKKFNEKNNNAAGTRTRKNAQELKKMLQELSPGSSELFKSAHTDFQFPPHPQL